MPRKQKADKPEKFTRYFDYGLLVILIFLLCFGLIMLYSASSYTAAKQYGDAAYYLKRQILNMAIGLALLVFLAFVDYHWWRRWGAAAYIIALLLCLAVYIPGLGATINNSTRWLRIGSLTFQPSELAKLAVILFLAAFLERRVNAVGTWKGILCTILVSLPILAVIAYQNLSTAIIVLAIAVCLLFVASPKYSHFVFLLLLAVVAALAFVLLVGGYRSERIAAWLNPETAEKGYQVMQGLYAIGSGGIFGKGFGNSVQKLGNVPEAQNDMIFAIICEELGAIGAVCVIVMYVLLLWRMMAVAMNAADRYGALIVCGVLAHIAIQVVLNIAVVTNSIPNTGVTLPFISYGGTSIIFLLAEVGLVLSVSRGIRLRNLE